MPISTKNLRMNEQIRVPQVRVIDAEGNQAGVMQTHQAIAMALDAGYDLVEVSPNSTPPVVRVMDFGKFKYELKKKEHKAKMKQHHVVLKEVRLRPKIEEHDQEVKLKHAREFLVKGSKVQFTMMFRGREMAHANLAMKIFDEIVATLADVGKIESPARMMGKRIIMVLAPGGKAAGSHGASTHEAGSAPAAVKPVATASPVVAPVSEATQSPVS